MFFSFLFYAFVVYLLYRLVFGFIIPVYRTTRKVKQGFREMNERMRQQTEAYNQQQEQPRVQTTAPKGDADDYIEFEEVK